MTIFDGLVASVPKMTIERAKHFCDLYEALYVVVCDFDDDPGVPMDVMLLHQELKTRMQKIRELKKSITNYKTDEAITLNKALEVLGEK